MADINWYPGHMAKSRRMLEEQLRAVDAVIELCDARAPLATRNPDLGRLIGAKPRVLALNKADLADERVTKEWLDYFRGQNLTALRFNANGGNARDMRAAMERSTAPVVERMRARGVNKTVRMMVVGIPNVGKSTFVNRLLGAKVAQVSDRPGVTRARQWVKVGPYLELMDTPGMLWPRLGDQEAALLLAYIGSVRDQAIDAEKLAERLLAYLMQIAPEAAASRFKLAIPADIENISLLELACAGRGFLLSGGRYDMSRGAAVALDEFRAGKIGRITLERPPSGDL